MRISVNMPAVSSSDDYSWRQCHAFSSYVCSTIQRTPMYTKIQQHSSHYILAGLQVVLDSFARSHCLWCRRWLLLGVVKLVVVGLRVVFLCSLYRGRGKDDDDCSDGNEHVHVRA